MHRVRVLVSGCLAVPVLALAQPRPPALPPAGDAPAYTDELMRHAQHDAPSIRGCYDGAFAHHAAAAQRVRSVSFIVDRDGQVLDLRIDPPGLAVLARFRTCMLTVVRGWRLTPPAGGTRVSLTYSGGMVGQAMHDLGR